MTKRAATRKIVINWFEEILAKDLDTPFVKIDGIKYTPRQLVSEIHHRTEVGEFSYRSLKTLYNLGKKK